MLDVKTRNGEIERFHFDGPAGGVIADMMLTINLLYNGMHNFSPDMAARMRQRITEAACDGSLWTAMPVAGTGCFIELGIKPRKEGGK